MIGSTDRRSSFMSELEPSAWLGSVAQVLDRLGVRWAVAGAIAANAYRDETRITSDLDLLVEDHPELAEAFRAAGWHVKEFAEEGETPHLLFLRGASRRVDLLVAQVRFEIEALQRAHDHVITLEDVIIFKLIAWRRRDQDDVRSILASGRGLDRSYVERWAEEWQVSELWRRALLDQGIEG
jgi:predicted nucleotidyltransferase